MKVIKIEEFSKTKCKVIIDKIVPLVLYKADLRRYQIQEGKILEERQIKILLEELLPYRAKMRCMKLLQSKDYTEYEIRKKLIADGYPESVIENTVEYLFGYHYLDDNRYVRLYYQSKSYKKSKKQIVIELQRKGIAKEMIVSVLRDVIGEEENTDFPCIMQLLRKKHYIDDEASFEEKEKIRAYLFRKGFEINDINVCMKKFSWENM